MPTEILFIRHGQTAGNLSDRFYDEPECELTEIGRLQAALAGCELRREYFGRRVSEVYSSPYVRVRQTCKIAMAESGLKYRRILCDDRLMERSFAGLAGKYVNCDGSYDGFEDAISQAQYRAIWTYGSRSGADFGIETMESLYDRTESFIVDISRRHPNGFVIVFSHGGLFRMFYGICKMWPKDGAFWSIKMLDNAGIARFTVRPGIRFFHGA